MQLQLKNYLLPLKHTFTISRESHDSQETLIVCLSLQGETGYGEATANTYYGITIDDMHQEIEAIRDSISTFNFTTPQAFYDFLITRELHNFTLCALDMAAHDLYGKLQGKPLYQIWNTKIDHYPITNYTIGIDTIENMVNKMKEQPWPIYKIKLGTSQDVEIVQELRKHSKAVFRIDANCAWTAKQTIAYAPALKELGVEFLEQPLKADDWQGMERVLHDTVLPIIADESCLVESDIDKCSLHFNGINIKLTKCGGLTPALRMIKKAKALGLKVMVGCMTESTVGTSAIAQLLPQLDYVDMDGPLLIKEDIADGVRIKSNGELIFPEIGGTGVTLLR